MKICLICPQTPFLEYISFPPINLLYLSSYLKKYRYNDVQIIDLNITNDIPPADIYAITATTPQFPYALELKQKLDGITIIGGAHATADPLSCNTFDKIIVGDGEKAIIQCIEDIEKNNDKHVYIGTQIANLDDVPMPNRREIDRENYRYFIDDVQSTIMITSRGCPYDCYFCQKINNINRNVRFHSNKYVLKELQDIIDCGYDGVYFEDDIFTMRKDLEYLSTMLKKMAWRCQIRPDEKIKNIRILGKMGCRHASIGIESGSQKLLDIVNKKVELKDTISVVKECKSQNIKVRAYIIIGLPSETHETIRETIEFLKMIEPDSIGIGTFIPYPGTYIYNHMKLFDIKIEERDYKKWYFRSGNGKYNCVVSTSGLTSDEILKYRDEIDKEFN